MPISTACPSCQQRLKLADTLVGKRVRCPKCQQVFSVPAAQDQLQVQKPMEPRARPVRPPEPLVPPLGDDDDGRISKSRAREQDFREGRPRRRKRQLASSQSNNLLYWAIGLGAGFFVLSLGCCGGGLWYYSKAPTTLQRQVSVAPPTNQVFPNAPQADENLQPKPKPKRPLDQAKNRLFFKDKGFSIVPPK